MTKLAILAASALIAGTGAAFSETRTTPTSVEIDTAITIAAPVEAVWAVLADLGAYGDWNPYHVSVSGDLTLGAELSVEVRKPNGNAVSLRPHVLELAPGRSLVWGGGPRWIFRGEHRFDLEPLGDGCTRLRHSEVFSGLFVRFAELGSIEEGYALMNRALKQHVEEADASACAA